MTCGFLDLACMAGNTFAPVFAFINAWAWLGWFVAGLIIGGILGWRWVVTILTAGIAFLLYERFKKAPEPDYETGEPVMPVTPKKRRYNPDTNKWE